jgi:hypothetical protein
MCAVTDEGELAAAVAAHGWVVVTVTGGGPALVSTAPPTRC